MGKRAARVLDLTSHGTPLGPGPGALTVLIGGFPAWRVGSDKHICPLFNGQAPPRIRQALQDSVKELISEGERKVKLQLRPGHGLITGHYRRSIHGEMTDSQHGRVHDSGVVYGPWLEGVSSRNETTRFKGYAMFRNTRQDLEKLKLQVLQKHVGRAVKAID